MANLSSAKAKLARALEHAKAAEKIIRAFFESNPYQIRQKQEGKNLVAEVSRIDPIPEQFGLLIGDAIHNLRSSLDHIAFVFAKPIDEQSAGQVAFPTISRPERFAENAKRRLPGVVGDILATFESLQPYNSGKFSGTECILHVSAINNWDKHRAIPLTLTSFEIFETEIETHGQVEVLRQDLRSGRVEAGTEITRLEIGSVELGAKVYVKAKLVLHPIFDNGMPDVAGLPVMKVLFGSHLFIERFVIPRFEKFL